MVRNIKLVAALLLASVSITSAIACVPKVFKKGVPADQSAFLCFGMNVSLNQDSRNLINTISVIEYRELNELLTDIGQWPVLNELTDEEMLIHFSAYVTIYKVEDWGESGSKEAVEAILSRYFGVEKIFHEKSSLYRSWLDWDVDYPIDGIGSIGNDWVNVIKLQAIGNGTFVADVDSYFTFDDNWDNSWLEHVSKWKIKSGVKIVNIDSETLWDEYGEPEVILICQGEHLAIWGKTLGKSQQRK